MYEPITKLYIIKYGYRKQVESMPEHQTIEYKESWHDEFLEWICGYANAYGGTLLVILAILILI